MAADNISESMRKRIVLDYLYDPSIVRAASENLKRNTCNDEQQEQADNEHAVWDESACSLPKDVTRPSPNYIEFRRIQNEQFITNTLEQGISSAKSDDCKKAEACYKSVLSVEPNHVDCLVAYGALCANFNGRRDDEAVHFFQRALEIDDQCPNAREYLDKVLNRNKLPVSEGNMISVERELSTGVDESNVFAHQSKNLIHSKRSALEDVLAERAFMDKPDTFNGDRPLSDREEDERHRKKRSRKHDDSRKSKKRKKDRKHKSKSSKSKSRSKSSKHRKHRRKSKSLSDESDSSSVSSG